MSRSNAIEKAHREFGGITASSAATICGVNPWESPYTLYQRLVGETPPLKQTWEMWLGSQMEGVIIRAFTRETHLKVSRPKRVFDPNFWFTTTEYGFPMGALLDGTTTDTSGPCVVEAKHASAFAGEEWDGEPPLMYWFQMQHQLACTGWRRCYAVALVGKKLIVLPVERDEELIALITDKEREFYHNHVVPRVPPPVDGHSATSALIKARYAHSEPGYAEVIEDPEVERLCEVYRAQGTALDALKQDREATKNQLFMVIKRAESAVVGRYKVSAKEQTRTDIDVERLRKELPEVAAQYARANTSRPLRVTERKGT